MGEHVIKDLLSHFDALYQAKWGFRYLFSGKDAKLMKDLLAVYEPETIKAFLDAFVASHDDFIAGTGYSLGAFRGCLPKVIASLKTQTRERRCQYGHVPPCDTSQACTRKMLSEQTGLRVAK